VEDKVTLEQLSLQVLQIFTITVIPTMTHTHSSVTIAILPHQLTTSLNNTLKKKESHILTSCNAAITTFSRHEKDFSSPDSKD
jgi:hypothetical protein